MADVFFSYSHSDEMLRNELEKHLSMLRRDGAITTWHDRRIVAGQHIDQEISKWLEKADVILLLISVDFLASEYCYSIEMKRAMERHKLGEAHVIPVILRPCDWHSAPFGRLLATPTDGKAVTLWPNQDDAFLDVAKAIRTAVIALKGVDSTVPAKLTRLAKPPGIEDVRSSNLRVRKSFTDRDKDEFLDQTFDYISRFFENSIKELHERNPEIDGSAKRNGNRIDATVYREGKAVSRCVMRVGNHGFGTNGISLSHGMHSSDNSINESLSVVAGEQSLALQALGFAVHGGRREEALSQQGAAEYYWSIFIEPLQR